MIKKRPDGKWVADIQPGGRLGKRMKRVFDTRTDAVAWLTRASAQLQASPSWTDRPRDGRRLSNLIDIWFERHGRGLSSGEETKRALLYLSRLMQNPAALSITPALIAKTRGKRIESGLSQNSVNRELAYLRAMFSELARVGEWDHPNPVATIRPFRVQEQELAWLSVEQIATLLAATRRKGSQNPHTYLITKLCLSTGARWSEAEDLTIDRLQPGAVLFIETKGKRNRLLPISTQLEAELRAHHDQHGFNAEGARRKEIFEPAWAAFRSAVKAAKIELPDGQLSHVLRHTFASRSWPRTPTHIPNARAGRARRA